MVARWGPFVALSVVVWTLFGIMSLPLLVDAVWGPGAVPYALGLAVGPAAVFMVGALGAGLVEAFIEVWPDRPTPPTDLVSWYAENDVSVESLERKVEQEWKNEAP